MVGNNESAKFFLGGDDTGEGEKYGSVPKTV
jgi:hypothetical protein